LSYDRIQHIVPETSLSHGVILT